MANPLFLPVPPAAQLLVKSVEAAHKVKDAVFRGMTVVKRNTPVTLSGLGNPALSAGKSLVSFTVLALTNTICSLALAPVLDMTHVSAHREPFFSSGPIGAWRYLTTCLWKVEREGYQPERTQIVLLDKATGNLVVRSSLPIKKDGTFALDEILQQVNKQRGLTGHKALKRSNIHLEVFTLQNRICEQAEWEHEARMVKQLNNDGVTSASFHPSPVLGAVTGPLTCLPVFLQKLFLAIPFYLTWTSMPALVDNLAERNKEALNGRTRLTLVHCAHGIDRTGMVCGALKMQADDASFEEVRIEAQLIARTRKGYNDIDDYDHKGLLHFAHYLKKSKKLSSVGKIEWNNYQHKKPA